MAVGLLLVVLMAASGAAPGSAGAEQGFCAKPVLPVGEAPPPFEPRLGIDRKIAGPGGKVRIRVENFGAKTISFGQAYRLAHWEKGRWVHLPTGPFFASLSSLQPGYAEECEVVDLPTDAEDGTYRIAKEVWPSGSGQKESTVIRATFRVR